MGILLLKADFHELSPLLLLLGSDAPEIFSIVTGEEEREPFVSRFGLLSAASDKKVAMFCDR